MRRLLSLVLFVSLALCGVARAQDNSFSFMIGADPQFGMTSANQGFERETANFEAFIKAANRLRPAFVIVCGDLVNRSGDAAQIAEYLRVAGELDPSIRLYNLPGNHDIGDKPTSEIISAYSARFGPDHYTFRSGHMAAFVLNSELIHSPESAPGLADEQEKWFAAELEKAKKEGAAPLVVFMHHPLFIHSADEPDEYFNIPLGQRRRYLELMHKFGVTYVFAGHYHREAIAADGELHMVTSGPIGKPLAKDPSGFRIVTVRKSGIEHAYHALDGAPEKAEASK